MIRSAAIMLVAFWLAASSPLRAGDEPAPRWWKGNLHAHSLWSDADGYPDMVVHWYRDHGYNFLGLSDHNIFPEGERWIDIETAPGGAAAFEKYLKTFGPDWVQTREQNGKKQVRLQPMDKLRELERPGRFLLVNAEELTAEPGPTTPVHVNAIGIARVIPVPSGATVPELLDNHIQAVADESKRLNIPMLAQIDHPNFCWVLTADDLARSQANHFEVHSGFPGINDGDTTRLNVERLWDIALVKRIEAGRPLLFGTGSDDAHSYHEFAPNKSNPGRGFNMVRSRYLTPHHLIEAMQKGDFYASNGVMLNDIRFEGGRFSLSITPRPGAQYVTQFIGTKKGYDPAVTPIVGLDGVRAPERSLATTPHPSKDVGAVLAEVSGPNPSYTLSGDELYVRAKVIENGKDNITKAAWIQPVRPGIEK